MTAAHEGSNALVSGILELDTENLSWVEYECSAASIPKLRAKVTGLLAIQDSTAYVFSFTPTPPTVPRIAGASKRNQDSICSPWAPGPHWEWLRLAFLSYSGVYVRFVGMGTKLAVRVDNSTVAPETMTIPKLVHPRMIIPESNEGMQEDPVEPVITRPKRKYKPRRTKRYYFPVSRQSPVAPLIPELPAIEPDYEPKELTWEEAVSEIAQDISMDMNWSSHSPQLDIPVDSIALDHIMRSWVSLHKLGVDCAGPLSPQVFPSTTPRLSVGFEGNIRRVDSSALCAWEKTCLEPVRGAVDIAYIAIAPAKWNHHDIGSFLRNLTSMYETCSLGRHTPMGTLGMLDSSMLDSSPKSEEEYYQTVLEHILSNIPKTEKLTQVVVYLVADPQRVKYCFSWFARYLSRLRSSLYEQLSSQRKRDVCISFQIVPETLVSGADLSMQSLRALSFAVHRKASRDFPFIFAKDSLIHTNFGRSVFYIDNDKSASESLSGLLGHSDIWIGLFISYRFVSVDCRTTLVVSCADSRGGSLGTAVLFPKSGEYSMEEAIGSIWSQVIALALRHLSKRFPGCQCYLFITKLARLDPQELETWNRFLSTCVLDSTQYSGQEMAHEDQSEPWAETLDHAELGEMIKMGLVAEHSSLETPLLNYGIDDEAIPVSPRTPTTPTHRMMKTDPPKLVPGLQVDQSCVWVHQYADLSQSLPILSASFYLPGNYSEVSPLYNSSYEVLYRTFFHSNTNLAPFTGIMCLQARSEY